MFAAMTQPQLTRHAFGSKIPQAHDRSLSERAAESSVTPKG